jgi:excinuclease UvrABC ATPase subunit
LIDLGPEGATGGEILAAGTPEEVAQVERQLHGPVSAGHHLLEKAFDG